jgi:hypothetical protein
MCYNPQVPKVGIEPTLPREHEFESCASACSATLAGKREMGLEPTTFCLGSKRSTN